MSGAKIIEGMQEAVAFARGEETGAVLHDVGSLDWWQKRAQWLSERNDRLVSENKRLQEMLYKRSFPADCIPMPQNADQAVGMWLIGENWVRNNAPERLKPEARAALAPSSDTARRT